MPQSIKVLDWDSNFFQLKVAQLQKNLFLHKDRDIVLNRLIQKDIKLAYYISDKPLENEVNDLYDFTLVNKRVPLEKKLTKVSPIHKKIEFYTDSFPNTDLLDLAQRAGVCSRFNLDPNIDQEKVKELYSVWITKSVQKEMAAEVLVYKEDNKIIGFMTFQIDRPQGKIPLFAIQREAEGKGVSFALMRAVDAILYQKGCTYYTSATQAENVAALTIFQRHGIEVKPVEYVYHLWRK